MNIHKNARLTPNISADHRILIPDMIAASLPDPDDIADKDLDASPLVDAMAARLTDLIELAPTPRHPPSRRRPRPCRSGAGNV